MERAQEAQPAAEARCRECGGALAERRCEHCGAAAQAGPYTVLRVLSASPHSRIYLAEDERGAKVALKELVYTLVPSAQELDAFEREAALLTQLEHPRIPRFVNSFTEGSGARTRLYLAQQYVAGESLEQRLERHHFDEDEVEGLARQALEILHWLHTRTPSVVHRDVKPANLVLAPDGALHLVDFGAARDVRAAVTHRSTLVGTVGYIAPEQLGGTSGPRSDLYALGATLLHLLTRRPPEQLAGTGMELDLREVSLTPRLRRFLERLVAAKAEDRFRSAGEALLALREGVPPRPSQRRTPLFLALAGALSLGAAALMSVVALKPPAPPSAVAPVVVPPAQAQEVPPVEEPIETPAPPPPAQPPDEARRPVRPVPATVAGFPHLSSEVAHWDFRTPGPTLLDTSGHKHSVAYPTEGYSYDFFGMNFDGTQRLVVPDSADFAPRGPFFVTVSLMLPAEELAEAQHLLTRRGANGLAWDVALGPGDRLRFTLSDGKGQTSTIEGPVKVKRGSSFSVYAEFDPTTGEQWLLESAGCTQVGHTVTALRPPKKLEGGVVTLVEGFRGHVFDIRLDLGLMLPAGGPGSSACALSGSKMPR